MTNDGRDYAEYVYEDSSSDAIKWVSAGFGIGLLVGGIVGLLMAPKSGQETREQLRGYAGDLSDRTRNLASDLGEKSREYASTVSEKVSHTTVDLKDRAREAAGAASDALRVGKEAVGKVAKAIKDIDLSDNGSNAREGSEAESA